MRGSWDNCPAFFVNIRVTKAIRIKKHYNILYKLILLMAISLSYNNTLLVLFLLYIQTKG